jgi:hypothetical protein
MMDEQVITTKRGKYGKIQVTLPLVVKHSIMENIERSGLSRAEFLRIALMMGSAHLMDGVRSHFREDDSGSKNRVSDFFDR